MLSDFLFLRNQTKTNVMNKSILLLISTFLFIYTASAQTQFDNASFEDWEEIGYGPNIIEPVEWSSIKSSDNDNLNDAAPHNWDRSDDAHTGNYSLYLKAVKVFGIVATGTTANGRYHADFNPELGYTFTDTINSQWHTVLTARPDSLTGWYKAKPSPGDFATVKTVLHTGYAQISAISDTSTFVASGVISLSSEEVSEWTRFSIPINYYKDIMPEYALVILTSGNGVSAVEGSEAWFDDLEYIYNDGTGYIEKDSELLEINTSRNTLSVHIKDAQGQPYAITIFDIMGNSMMIDEGLSGQQNRFTLDIPSGVYVIKVQYQGNIHTKKVLF